MIPEDKLLEDTNLLKATKGVTLNPNINDSSFLTVDNNANQADGQPRKRKSILKNSGQLPFVSIVDEKSADTIKLNESNNKGFQKPVALITSPKIPKKPKQSIPKLKTNKKNARKKRCPPCYHSLSVIGELARKIVVKGIDHPAVVIFMSVLTTNKDGDYIFFMLNTVLLGLFAMEIILASLFKPEYFLSFFFFLDTISTITMLFDIEWIGGMIFDSTDSTQQASNAKDFAKLGRASRVGARASRIIRIIRLVRLIRIVKLYKHARQGILLKEAAARDPNKFQKKKRSLILDEPQIELIKGMSILDKKKNSEQLSHTNTDGGRRRSSIFLEESPTKFNPLDVIKEEQDSRENINVKAEVTETNVGKKLSDLITKKVIILVLTTLFVVNLFSSSTYYSNVTSYEEGIKLLYYNSAKNDEINLNRTWDMLLRYNDANERLPIGKVDLIMPNLTEVVFTNDRIPLDDLRSSEIEFYSYSRNDIVVGICQVDIRKKNNLEAWFSIIKTIFVLIVLGATAILLSKDSTEMVLNPIESMMEKVKRISDNPLQAAQIEEEEALAEEELKNTEDKNKKKKKGLESETLILERTLIKIGGLLALGLGEAGAAIIAENMKQEGEVNPLIAGRKVFGIFGFCDIRNFTDATEVLQKKVMIFVNEIAEIVHGTADSFHGAANKNIGDAFLIVWKIPEDKVSVNSEEHMSLKDVEFIKQFSDMSLLAFYKTMIEMKKSQNMFKYSKHKGLQERIPGFNVKMGFGLHFGWAIEGAIGSHFKIDTSYLSPNVNMASRLEAATKQFGSPILIRLIPFPFSGPLYSLFSEETKLKCRKIDCVKVKGSDVPLDLFTCDIDLNPIETVFVNEVNIDLKEKKISRFLSRNRRKERFKKILQGQMKISHVWESDEDFKKAKEAFTPEFYKDFALGIDHYITGRWDQACKVLEKTRTMIPNRIDGPSSTLLEFMKENNLKPPSDWEGVRALVDK